MTGSAHSKLQAELGLAEKQQVTISGLKHKSLESRYCPMESALDII